MNRAFSSSQYRAECGERERRVWDIKYLCEVATGGERQSDPGVLTNTEYNTISSQTCRIKVMFDNSQTPTGNLAAKILKTAYHCLLRVLECVALSSHFVI